LALAQPIKKKENFMKKTIHYNLGILCACLALFSGMYLGIGVEPVQASPVVMQAPLASPNGTLKDVSLGPPHSAPFFPTDTTLTVIGTADTQYNNMGWRASDGYLYGIELTDTGNTGKLVKIDPATGQVVSMTTINGLPTDVQFYAGDVNNQADVLYISNPRYANPMLYTLNLSTLALSSVPITGATGDVADWAYDPKTGYLYGVDTQGQFATLNPITGVRTDSAAIAAPLLGYGAAWYDPTDGDVYVYRNSSAIVQAFIYQIDPSTATVINQWGAPVSPLLDGAYIVPIPPTAWLFASGLLGLGLLGWRRKRS
jgi:hypothetical protein